MRHFLRSKGVQRRSGPITLLTLGVGVTATQTGLIAASGRTDRASASLTGASRAVALAAVAAAANQYGGAAASAQVASSGEVHWSPWPMGKDGDTRFVTYFACSVASSQLWARHRSWLGGWSRCRARVSTGRSDIYRISDADATPTQTLQTRSHSSNAVTGLGRGRPFVAQSCRAPLVRRWIAMQSLRREPCGQQTAQPV